MVKIATALLALMMLASVASAHPAGPKPRPIPYPLPYPDPFPLPGVPYPTVR